MYIFKLFVVSFIVIVVFTIQSDAVGDNKGKGPSDEANLPYEVLGDILQRSGLNEAKAAGRSRALISGSRDAMSRIFENRLLVINFFTTSNYAVETSESLEDGRIIFDFGNYAKLKSLFATFGEHARSIFINYNFMDASIRRDINKNIVNKYSEYFTELRIHVSNDSGIWEEISNENGQIQFPNVKKFRYVCDIAGTSRRSMDLNAIFPKLESVMLGGSIKDPKCLANVRNLKELTLSFAAIPELQLKDIFAKNKQISKLHISPQKIETLQLIENNLKDLRTLEISNAGNEFLTGSSRLYILPSVTSFYIQFHEANQIQARLSFKMPNLKRLTVRRLYNTQHFCDFINQFENLDTLDMETLDIDDLSYIKNLRNVKEYISPFLCDQLSLLRDFFENFDETKSKLSTFKLICFENTKHDNHAEMKKINRHLKKSNKPTWTLTDAVEDGTNQNYLLIKRDP